MHEMVLEILLILVAMIQILILSLIYLSRDMRQRLRMEAVQHSTSAVSPSGTVANISLSPSPRSPRTLGRKSFAL